MVVLLRPQQPRKSLAGDELLRRRSVCRLQRRCRKHRPRRCGRRTRRRNRQTVRPCDCGEKRTSTVNVPPAGTTPAHGPASLLPCSPFTACGVAADDRIVDAILHIGRCGSATLSICLKFVSFSVNSRFDRLTIRGPHVPIPRSQFRDGSWTPLPALSLVDHWPHRARLPRPGIAIPQVRQNMDRRRVGPRLIAVIRHRISSGLALAYSMNTSK